MEQEAGEGDEVQAGQPGWWVAARSPPAALATRLQHPRIQDGCQGLPIPADLRLEAAGVQPAARLLINRRPGGKLVGSRRQGAPVRTIQRTALKTSRSG